MTNTSNAPRVAAASFQRALLYIAASAFTALLPFLMDNSATFDVSRALKAFSAAAITAFAVRMMEGGFDAYRAANGQVSRSDVGAFSPSLNDQPLPAPPGSPTRLVSNVQMFPPPGAVHDREGRPR